MIAPNPFPAENTRAASPVAGRRRPNLKPLSEGSWLTSAYARIARMSAFIDLSGQRFGRLTVICRSDQKRNRTRSRAPSFKWLCKCDCGNDTHLSADSLKSKTRTTISCGCFGRERRFQPGRPGKGSPTHGLSRHPLYQTWKSMIGRCTDQKDREWTNYGGRGITVCDEWTGNIGLVRFIQDMGERPSLTRPREFSIERRDNNSGYSLHNCKWATNTEQTRNSRQNVILTFRGESLCVTAWAERIGIGHHALRKRLKLGWSVERALTSPKA